jgi:hypothetical protein
MNNNYFEIIGFIASIGFVYGTLNNRLKQLEKQMNDAKDISDRLSRIEEKTNFLIDHFIKK